MPLPGDFRPGHPHGRPHTCTFPDTLASCPNCGGRTSLKGGILSVAPCRHCDATELLIQENGYAEWVFTKSGDGRKNRPQ